MTISFFKNIFSVKPAIFKNFIIGIDNIITAINDNITISKLTAKPANRIVAMVDKMFTKSEQ